MISEEDVYRIRDDLGRPALAALRLDLDGFIEASEAVGSPDEEIDVLCERLNFADPAGLVRGAAY